MAAQGAVALLQLGLAPWPLWCLFPCPWGEFPLFSADVLQLKLLQNYWTRACSASDTCVIFFFLNNQCRQISILLSWHQNEHLKVNKGLHLQSGFLCLRNKCLFSLSFVGSSDKSHFWTKDANWDISDGQLGNLMGKCEYPTPNLI